MDTEQLIRKCLKNSRSAQLKLYDKYCQGMFAIALRYVKQTDVAEDVMQEAFIRAFERLADYDPEKSFGAWLKRITINLAIDHQRSKMPTIDLDKKVIQLQDTAEDDEWQVDDRISKEMVQECIERLSVKDATILKLFLLEGYDHEEISMILEQSNNACRTQLHRAKKRLQELLKNKEDERSAQGF